MKNTLIVVAIIMGILFLSGIVNGMTSTSWPCGIGELDMDVPGNKVFFPHSAGYIIGRYLTQSPESPCWIIKRKDGKSRWRVKSERR